MMRAIDIGTNPHVIHAPGATGEAPELVWIKVADLVIDDSYQRPLGAENWTAIRKIAAGFHWGRFSPIVVAPLGGGRYALIDGQHRAHAAKLCGIEAVPAMSVRLTQAEQAAAFAAINGNVIAMSAFHIYRAALAAGEPWAVQARDAVTRGQCVLMDYNKSGKDKRAREIYCVTLIRRLIEGGQAEVVSRGLLALSRSNGSYPETFTAGVLGPWLDIVAQMGASFSDEALSAFVDAEDLVELRDVCVRLSKTDDYRAVPIKVLFRSSIQVKLKAFRPVARRSA